MGDESTQLDLSAELDRLSAMRDGDGDGDGETDAGPRIEICGAVVDPETVTNHRMVGMTVDADVAELRGARWRHPLHRLRDDEATLSIDGEPASVGDVVDAVGGPDLTDGYVLDRATYAVWAIDAGGVGVADRDGAVGLRALEVPSVVDAGTGDTRAVTTTALRAASRPGFDDGARYRLFGPVGEPLDPTEPSG